MLNIRRLTYENGKSRSHNLLLGEFMSYNLTVLKPNGVRVWLNLETIVKLEETPEYLEWFSTHPPASKRLRIVKNAK